VAGKVKSAVKTELSFLAADRLVAWLEALAAGETQVLVPSKADGTFVTWQGDEPDLRGITATSSKSLVLPQHETFLSYRYQDGGSVEVTPIVNDTERVVFGARLCDMHGLLCIDQTFGETGPSGADPNFMARRERTTFVSVACTEADVDGACFCATFFTPDSYGAADAVVHPVEGGFVLRPLTDKGARVVELAAGAGASTASVPEAPAPAQGTPVEIKDIEEKLLGVFNDDELWNDVTEACVSCGACSFVCPTCYCFSITDEARGSDCGDRLRCWDSCGFACYTKEASGHNPRSRNAKRFRNRVNHKFTYYPELYNLESCVGCGRCVRACPAAVDIRDMVEAVMAR
jgi:sulfhydrogenase subunit beta (sulfur reductase)